MLRSGVAGSSECSGLSCICVWFHLFRLSWIFVVLQSVLQCAWASHCRGFSCGGAQSLECLGFSGCWSRVPLMWCTGLLSLPHVRSSQTRDQSHVSCIRTQILYHWASREAPWVFYFEPFFQKSPYCFLQWLNQFAAPTSSSQGPFPRASRPSVCLLWKNVRTDPMPTFPLGFFFLLMWSCIKSLYSLDIDSLQIHLLHAVDGLLPLLVVSFPVLKLSCLFDFAFGSLARGDISRPAPPGPRNY